MIFFWITLFLVLGTFSYAGIIGAPWVPTRRREREHLVGLVDLQPEQTVYDLGSGNGAVLFAIHDRFPGVRCIGYELSLLPYALAHMHRWRCGRRYADVSLRYGNAYYQDISDGDVIFIYLLEGAYTRVLKFLRAAQLKDESTVIVQGWPLPGVPYQRHVKNEGCLSLYFYKGSDFK